MWRARTADGLTARYWWRYRKRKLGASRHRGRRAHRRGSLSERTRRPFWWGERAVERAPWWREAAGR
eukprot:scaffold36346_cov112-Isochrysis_galbana.AAC.1